MGWTEVCYSPRPLGVPQKRGRDNVGNREAVVGVVETLARVDLSVAELSLGGEADTEAG